MKIGIDIDDTITDTYYIILKYVSEKLNIDYEMLKGKNYNYDQIYFGVDGYPPMSDYILENFHKMIPIIKPKINSIEIMRKLINEGNEIVLITARSHALPNQNIEYLNKNGIPYTKFYEGIHDKGILSKNEEISIFIDDSVNNCKRVEEFGIKTLLFDAPYNRDCNDFQRVSTWQEVYDIVKGE